MITKKQFLDSLIQEANVCKHLHGKLTAPMFDFRCAPNMRSTLEVLQYLSMCLIGPAKSILHSNWAISKGYREEAAKMVAADFPKRMDQQIEEMKSLLGELLDADLLNRDVTYPWGGGEKLGMALINCPLKFITAYRMQLFMQAKMAGLSELNTANCWRGTDMPLPNR